MDPTQQPPSPLAAFVAMLMQQMQPQSPIDQRYSSDAIAKGRALGVPSQANEPQSETGRKMQFDLRSDPDARMMNWGR